MLGYSQCRNGQQRPGVLAAGPYGLGSNRPLAVLPILPIAQLWPATAALPANGLITNSGLQYVEIGSIHFGGSLFALTDPFYMLMYMHVLGREYRVWDQTASIRFIQPGKGIIRAHFELTEQHIQQARRATADGSKYFAEHTVQLFNTDQEMVAEVNKTIYIRRKRRESVES